MGNVEEEHSNGYPFMEQDNENSLKSCKCSRKTRYTGFIVAMVVGWLISIFGMIVFFIRGDVVLFAVMYSIGQVVNIVGSCFLAGPKSQCKDMFKSKRIVFTVAYLACIVITIVMAIVLPSNIRFLIIFPLILQFVSYFLYTLSYIPFGRKILKKFCLCIIEE